MGDDYEDKWPHEMTREELLSGMGAERVWWCEYPEFNDPNCMTGTSFPRPGSAALPHKHTRCRWVWIVKEAEDG